MTEIQFNDLPAVGQPLAGGLFVGLTTRHDGMHCAVVLLTAAPSKRLGWDAAAAWAAEQDGELPTRHVSTLLFANLRGEFDAAWHWTAEKHEDDGAYAWGQDFGNGFQLFSHTSYEARVRAVRLIPLEQDEDVRPIRCEATYARRISALQRAQTSEVLNIKEPSQVFRPDESLVLGLVRLRQEVDKRNSYRKITGYMTGVDWLNPLMADKGFAALYEVNGTFSDLLSKALAGEWTQFLGVPVYTDRALKPDHAALTLPANRLVFLTENQAFHFDVDPSVLTARSPKK